MADANALQMASYRGDEQEVKLLLDNGADVNAQGGGYGNALQAASYRGHEQVVKLLLDNGADVSAQGGEYDNALQAASSRGHEQVVKLLLDNGADFSAQGGEYGNALQAASYRGHEQVVKLLLDKGADVNVQGGNCRNALCAALSKNHEAAVKLLFDKGTDPNAQGGYFSKSNALYVASSRGHKATVKLLLEKGADPNAQAGYFSKGNALQAALEGGYEAIVKLLLDKGADPNAQGGYYKGNALYVASYKGYEAIVKLLLDKGADPNAQGGYSSKGNARQVALEGGHEQAPEHGTESFEELDFELLPSLDSVCRMISIANSGKNGKIFEGKCRVYWDILKFCEKELDQGARLHNVVTVTGTPERAEMDSCEGFVKKRWFSSALIDFLNAFTQEALEIPSPIKLYTETHLSIDGVYEDQEHGSLTYTCFSISGLLTEIGQLIQQLAWLTAAFTLPKENVLTASTAVLRIVNAGLIEIRPKKIDDPGTLMLDRAVPEVNTTCWHHLLRGAVLACGFPISPREDGMGLEIPFDLMVGLADIRTKIDFAEEAVLLGGPRIILYPTKVLRDGIQWHCAKADADLAELDSSSTTYLLKPDFKELSSRRTFLGHYRLAEVHLATEELVKDMADHDLTSNFPQVQARVELAREGTFSGGFSIKSIFSLSVSAKYVVSKTLRVSLDGHEYHDNFHCAKEQPVILYDAATESAWLVSEMSLVLHITLAYLSLPHIKIRRDLPGDWPPLPYAKPSSDGGLEAYTVCMENRNIELWCKTEEKRTLFRHVIEDTLRDIRSIKTAMNAQSQGRSLRKSGLRGWDYVGLLKRRNDTFQKEVPRKSYQTWWELVKKNEMLVILGRGFGDLIRPCRNSGHSGPVHIPPKAGLLVASKPCVNHLKPREDGVYRLGSLEWRSAKQRTCCNNACGKTSCFNIQTLTQKPPSPRDNTEVPSQDVLDAQALIFGDLKHYQEALANEETGRSGRTD